LYETEVELYILSQKKAHFTENWSSSSGYEVRKIDDFFRPKIAPVW
jgi:hypothetical protein